MGLFNKKNKNKPKKPNVLKKIAGGVKKATSKLKSATSKIKASAKKTVKKLKSGVTIGILTPFKPAMAAIVKSRGQVPEKGTEKLARQFVSKNSYDPDFIDPVSVSALISIVVGYFKKLKAKKEAGEKLSKEEEEALKMADSAVEGAMEGIEEEVANQVGKKAIGAGKHFANNWYFYVGGFVSLIILIIVIKALSGDKKTA